MKNVTETNRLAKNFGALCAIDRPSLAVEKGKVFDLLGPNGAGKTIILLLRICIQMFNRNRCNPSAA